MTIHLEPPAGTTVYIPFTTYGASGESLTMSGFATSDILIYKNGSITQRSSTAGFTLLDTDGIDFDGVTGLHGFSIDLNDNTDAGFYAAGSFYWVVVSTITVNTQVVTLLAATLRIKPAENTAGTSVVDVGRINNVATTSVTTVNANVGTTQPVNFTGTGASALAKSDMVDIAGAAVSTSTAQIGVNVVNYGGSAGTFASGRPEVNVSHFGGTAGTFSAGRPQVNTSHIAGTLQAVPGTTGGITLVKFAGVPTAVTSSSFTFTFTGDPTGTSAWFTSTGVGTENRVIDSWDSVNNIATVVPDFALTHSGTFAVELDSLGARVATQLEEDLADVKGKTDQLTFTVAGSLDANIQFVNDGQVTGSGHTGDEWGPT